MFKAKKGDKYLFDIEDFKNDTNTFIVFDEQEEQAKEFICYIKGKRINVDSEDVAEHNLAYDGIVMCIGNYTGRLRVYLKKK